MILPAKKRKFVKQRKANTKWRLYLKRIVGLLHSIPVAHLLPMTDPPSPSFIALEMVPIPKICMHSISTKRNNTISMRANRLWFLDNITESKPDHLPVAGHLPYYADKESLNWLHFGSPVHVCLCSSLVTTKIHSFWSSPSNKGNAAKTFLRKLSFISHETIS